MKLIEKLSLYEGATSEKPGLQFLETLASDLNLKIVKDRQNYNLELSVKSWTSSPIAYSPKSALVKRASEVSTGIILDREFTTVLNKTGLRSKLVGYDIVIDGVNYKRLTLVQQDPNIPIMSVLPVFEKALLTYLKGAVIYYRGLSDLNRELQNRLASMLQIDVVDPPESILSYFINAKIQNTKDPYTSIRLTRVVDKRITNYPILFTGLLVDPPIGLFSSSNSKKFAVSKNFFIRGRKARKMLMEKYPGIFPLWLNAKKPYPGEGSIRFKESLPLDKALDILEFMIRYTIKEREARKAREPKY